MIKTTICGACGKMGKMLCMLINDDSEMELVGAIESKHSPCLDKSTNNIKIISNIEDVLDNTDVIIDFSTPDGTYEHIIRIKDYKKPIVIGTTGFNSEQIEKIKEASENMAIVLAPNMSLGVNILFNLVKEVASILTDYDIEIVEMHHRLKKDAPSGTALKLGEYAAKGLGKSLSEIVIYGREGLIGERKKDEIGITSLRGGDVVGEHTVIFAGLGERIELTHKASSRKTFARGAIKAAKWVIRQSYGLYDMRDVLNIK